MRKLFLALMCLICAPAFASTCYVTEAPFTSIYYQAIPLPGLAEQTVAVSGVSAQSAAFNKLTYIIRINCDAIVSIEVGVNPTATTSTLRIPANQTEYFVVQPGNKIAFITNN